MLEPSIFERVESLEGLLKGFSDQYNTPLLLNLCESYSLSEFRRAIETALQYSEQQLEVIQSLRKLVCDATIFVATLQRESKAFQLRIFGRKATAKQRRNWIKLNQANPLFLCIVRLCAIYVELWIVHMIHKESCIAELASHKQDTADDNDAISLFYFCLRRMSALANQHCWTKVILVFSNFIGVDIRRLMQGQSWQCTLSSREMGKMANRFFIPHL